MTTRPTDFPQHPCRCCSASTCNSGGAAGVTRREFLAGAGAVTASALALSTLQATAASRTTDPDRQPPIDIPLKVQPVLVYHIYKKRPTTSWRPWGGLLTEQIATEEKERIGRELAEMASSADFPLEILPLVTAQNRDQAAAIAKGEHDVLIMYPASGGLDILETLTAPKRWTLMFVRHRSGPIYLWYEIAHNRYLRKTVDGYGQPGMDVQDVVVDSHKEILWRLRALHGLKNTLGKRIVAVGGPSGWGRGGQKAPEISREFWKMDIRNVSYDALGDRLKLAFNNEPLMKRCKNNAKRYLKQRGVSLHTGEQFVANAFLLTEVFKDLLDEAQTDAITINHCMGTIIPISETTACLPLSLLNDEGYMAFCESDFVVIPSGILLHYISGTPVFLNDPTYPHDGVVTLAHCTAPRKMDGKRYERTKILTHFESDYGAAPKVEMRKGKRITVLDPDFDNRRWLGFEGEIIDAPFYNICRSQIDVQINGDCDKVLEETRGFHWMVSYGNYLQETGYALKKVGVDWLNLSPQKRV